MGVWEYGSMGVLWEYGSWDAPNALREGEVL